MSQHKIIEDKWNEIFVKFLDQMNGIFPDSPASQIKTTFHISNFLGGRKPIVVFLDHLDEHKSEIETENDNYFFNEGNNIPFVKQLNLDKYYRLSSEENKKFIWQYIKTLYQLSKVYNTI